MRIYKLTLWGDVFGYEIFVNGKQVGCAVAMELPHVLGRPLTKTENRMLRNRRMVAVF
jgi:hypothetical protein